MRSVIFSISLLLLASCGNEQPENDTATTVETPAASALQTTVDSIAKSVKAKIAVASINVETGDIFYYNATDHVPPQSTIKFPVAIMIMKQVDSGKMALNKPFTLLKDELTIGTNSTLVKDLHGATSMSVHKLLEYMTHVSDNISFCGFTRHLGGAKQIEVYIKSTGLNDISVTPMEGRPYVDFNNMNGTWCTPQDMAKLMVKFYKGELMSKTSTDTLRSIMERTTGGTKRIKGLLPEGTVVAHKTGSSNTVDGKTLAVNDIGIVTLPNGQHIALAVYVHDITGDMEYGEGIIAEVAKVIYNSTIIGDGK